MPSPKAVQARMAPAAAATKKAAVAGQAGAVCESEGDIVREHAALPVLPPGIEPVSPAPTDR